MNLATEREKQIWALEEKEDRDATIYAKLNKLQLAPTSAGELGSAITSLSDNFRARLAEDFQNIVRAQVKDVKKMNTQAVTYLKEKSFNSLANGIARDIADLLASFAVITDASSSISTIPAILASGFDEIRRLLSPRPDLYPEFTASFESLANHHMQTQKHVLELIKVRQSEEQEASEFQSSKLPPCVDMGPGSCRRTERDG